MATHLAIVHFPWSFKLLYGIITDKVPLFGKYRKPYVVLLGMMQFKALVWLFIDRLNLSPFFFTFQLTVASFALAVLNVISDALICERVNWIESAVD